MQKVKSDLPNEYEHGDKAGKYLSYLTKKKADS